MRQDHDEIKTLVICIAIISVLLAFVVVASVYAPQNQPSEPEPYNYTENNSGGFIETKQTKTPVLVPVTVQSVEWKPIAVNVTSTPEPTAVPVVTPTYWIDTRQQPVGYPKYMTCDCWMPFVKDDSHPECKRKVVK